MIPRLVPLVHKVGEAARVRGKRESWGVAMPCRYWLRPYIICIIHSRSRYLPELATEYLHLILAPLSL